MFLKVGQVRATLYAFQAYMARPDADFLPWLSPEILPPEKFVVAQIYSWGTIPMAEIWLLRGGKYHVQVEELRCKTAIRSQG